MPCLQLACSASQRGPTGAVRFPRGACRAVDWTRAVRFPKHRTRRNCISFDCTGAPCDDVEGRTDRGGSYQAAASLRPEAHYEFGPGPTEN